MGMYTRLVLNVAIKENTDSVGLIEAMLSGSEAAKDQHHLDGCRRWMLGGSSYYHDDINSTKFEYDKISRCCKLSICCDFKNYENEIKWFLERIAKDVDTTGCAGYVRYEENIFPTLIWFCKGEVLELPVSGTFELQHKIEQAEGEDA